ncbi:MAG: VWA domain-containing protein [Bacteroidales bacterium]|nr:VWA domain-containing protein [Bacteroidales bacterium]
MKHFVIRWMFVLGMCVFFSAQVQGQYASPPLTRILILYDASHSMLARWQSDTRMNIARHVVTNLLDSLETVDNLEVALRVFGHQKRYPPQDCDDTRLEVPFGPDGIARIRQKLRTIQPRGSTPITNSLENAAGDFPPCANCRNIIILITDGLEECGGDPCATSRELQLKGIFLKPYVIGIGRDFRDAFDCVGHYFDATTESGFRASMNVIISQVLGKTSSQINLLDLEGRPTETNVAVSFFDQETGRPLESIIHTMNFRGLPDTIFSLIPSVKYRMAVHTTPPVEVKDISIQSGRHNIIAADVPQGLLNIRTSGQVSMNYQAIVRKSGQTETLKLQQMGMSEKYLVGLYDIEVLSLPRVYVQNVEIKQSHTTQVEIPQPGIAVIRLRAPGYANILQENETGLVHVYSLREQVSNETIYLQPGSYRLVYRSRVSTSTAYSTEMKFTIEPGQTVRVDIN